MITNRNPTANSLLDWLPRREQQELGSILLDGEVVLFATNARIMRSVLLVAGSWRVFVTTFRLLCIQGYGLGSRRTTEIRLSDIAAVDVRTHLLQRELIVTSGRSTLHFGGLSSIGASQLAFAISNARDHLR
jgi:hypothetical protein